MKSASNTIKYPYIAPLLGGGSFITFSVCTYIAVMEQAFQSVIGFGIFALAGLLLLLTINWKIQYDETGFTYRNLFRMSRHYYYNDVDSVRNLMGDTILVIGHRLILLDSGCTGNVFEFLNRINAVNYQAE